MATPSPSEFEKDLFRELINISVVKAGDAFARISREPVLLNAPEIKFVEKSELIQRLIQENDVRLIVQSEIKGDIYGHSLLFFSDPQIQQLSEINLSGKVTPDMQTSLFMEISNILTGSLVSQLANFLKINIYGSVPHAPYDLKKNPPGESFYHDLARSQSLLVTVHTNFINRKSHVNMPLVLVFDMQNMDKILEYIRNKNQAGKLLMDSQRTNRSNTTG